MSWVNGGAKVAIISLATFNPNFIMCDYINNVEVLFRDNRERNNLIDQINAGFAVLIDKSINKESSFTLTFESLLGTGKNKFYKGEDK